MNPTKVSAVMTAHPITVSVDTPCKQIAELIVGNGISSVGVTDKFGTLVGVVSEKDFLPYYRVDSNGQHLEWRKPNGHQKARKSPAKLAQDLMSSHVFTVSADALLSEAAKEFTRLGTSKLFVTRGSDLVGVLSLYDLLGPFARGDRELRKQIEEDVIRDKLSLSYEQVRVAVEQGVVTVVGRVERKSEIAPISALIRDIPGVVSVENRLDYVWNDLP